MSRSLSPFVNILDETSGDECSSPTPLRLHRAGTLPRGRCSPGLGSRPPLLHDDRPKSWCGAADDAKMKEQHIAKYLSSIVPLSPGCSERPGAFFSDLRVIEPVSTPVDDKQPSAVALTSHVMETFDASCSMSAPKRSPGSESSDSTCGNSDSGLLSPSIVRINCPAIDGMVVNCAELPADSNPEVILPGSVIKQVQSYEALTPRCSSPQPSPQDKPSPESSSTNQVQLGTGTAVALAAALKLREGDGSACIEQTKSRPSSAGATSERPLSTVLERVMDIEAGRSADSQSDSNSLPMEVSGGMSEHCVPQMLAQDTSSSASLVASGRASPCPTHEGRVQHEVLTIESRSKDNKPSSSAVPPHSSAAPARSVTSLSPVRRSFSVVLSRHPRPGRAARRSVSDMSELSPAQIRRAMATDQVRRSPQARHRALTLGSPRSRRRDHASHATVKSTQSDSFVTYIPTIRTADERPTFQSVLQRFRELGQGEHPPKATSSQHVK